MTARFPRARRILLDGAEVIVLPPDDYERLDSIRRQAGAQATRIHSLRQQLANATATLDAIAAAVRHARHAAPDTQPDACACEFVLQILGSAAANADHRHGQGQPPPRTDSA
jgi:hypothetical protein